MYFPSFVGILRSCMTLCPFQFCKHLEVEQRAGRFAFIDLQMYCCYKFSATLPHGDVGWSAVCACGIS